MLFMPCLFITGTSFKTVYSKAMITLFAHVWYRSNFIFEREFYKYFMPNKAIISTAAQRLVITLQREYTSQGSVKRQRTLFPVTRPLALQHKRESSSLQQWFRNCSDFPSCGYCLAGRDDCIVIGREEQFAAALAEHIQRDPEHTWHWIFPRDWIPQQRMRSELGELTLLCKASSYS